MSSKRVTTLDYPMQVKHRRASCGNEVVYASFSTPIGPMIASSCSNGLHRIRQDRNISDENFCPKESTEVNFQTDDDKNLKNDALTLTLKWLQAYFDGDQINLTLPLLCWEAHSYAGSFTIAVWKKLLESSHYGKTVTYGDLALLCGANKGAARAVGSAMRNNPFQLLVPCHRVLPAQKNPAKGVVVGSYSGGERNETKKWLLQHEGVLDAYAH